MVGEVNGRGAKAGTGSALKVAPTASFRHLSFFLLTLCLLSSLCFIATRPVSASAVEEIAKGSIIEKVACRSDQKLSYALFLPSNYTPAKKWPILYGFDPGARGHMPVERFKTAAEKYGYIIAGSNNSRNGAMDLTVAAIKAMLDDTHARFSIDDKRIYATGFSGGARVACSLGYMLPGAVAGVIACGGGFPSNISPSRATPFALFGTAGKEDFNLPEMKQLDKTLDELAVPNRLEVFEGGHEWATADLCTEALGWMEIQAMKTGRRAKDERLIDDLLNQEIARAREHESSNKIYEAYIVYDRIAADFKGLKGVLEFEKRASELKDSKEVKLALKQEQDQDRKQAARFKELFALKGSLRDSDARAIAMADLKRGIESLKKKSEEKEPGADRTVARRVLNQFFVFLSEEAMSLTQRKSYTEAAQDLAIAAEIAPNNPRLFFNLARLYSLNNDKSRAIEALKKAVKKGFKDATALEGDKDLDLLRNEAGYKRILEEIKKSS
ncbi:MAG TPA: tetratricopeptide repeat protein [Blastocatellia bacterium]|jgi:predicted esterase